VKLIGTKYGSAIGSFMLSYAQAGLFIGLAFQIMNASTWYNTTGRYMLPSWLNGWGFFGLLTVGLATVLLLFKYFITPAYTEHTSKVTWNSNNPSRPILESHTEELKSIRAEMESMRKELLNAIKDKNS
jgi:hypothetical protein